MAAVRRPHAEQRVAGRQQREVHGEIRLRARVRLHVRVAGAEQPLRAVDRELLDDVGLLATRIVAMARVAVGVFVREQRALRREHARAHVVLRRDELEIGLLPHPLGRERARHVDVEVSELRRVEHGQAASSSTTRVHAVARFVRLYPPPPMPSTRPSAKRSASTPSRRAACACASAVSCKMRDRIARERIGTALQQDQLGLGFFEIALDFCHAARNTVSSAPGGSGMLSFVPAAGPRPVSLRLPVPG